LPKVVRKDSTAIYLGQTWEPVREVLKPSETPRFDPFGLVSFRLYMESHLSAIMKLKLSLDRSSVSQWELEVGEEKDQLLEYIKVLLSDFGISKTYFLKQT